MTLEQGLVILAGAFAGGFVNGLTGFGTGLVAIGIWLHVLPPSVVTLLVIICSVVAQIQNVHLMWGAVEWRQAWPFLIPGLVGVPIGAQALYLLDAQVFKVGIGVLLMVYAGLTLSARRFCSGIRSNLWGNGSVGLASGILAGIAGLSGPLMVIWTDLTNEAKAVRRGLLQAFNLTILGAALASHVVAGNMTAPVWTATLTALPGTLVAAWIGGRVYQRLGDRNYRIVVLAFLMLAGLTLLFSARR